MSSVPELSKNYLEEQYIRNGKTRSQIESETGVNKVKIGTLLQKYGIKRSCVYRHGLSKHPLNAVWRGMKERCTNKNSDNYRWYGEKGIGICDEWKTFVPFYTWAIEHGWNENMSIDRIDNKRGYSPDNCRIVPLHDQFLNRSTNVYITVDGVTKLQCEWERFLNRPKGAIAKWKHRRGIDYAIKKIREEIESHSDKRAFR